MSNGLIRPEHQVPAPTSELTSLETAGSASHLLALAIEKGATVEQLRELVALRREVAADEARQKFFEALAAFQRECPPIKKENEKKSATSGGGDFGYTWAALDTIARTVNPILAKHGLSYNWDALADEKTFTSICTLRHIAGHEITSRVTIPIASRAGMSEQQKVSSARTFGDRLSLSSVLGITTTDDDPSRDDADPTVISEDQATHIEDLLKETKAPLARFLKHMGAQSVAEIRAVEYKKAVTVLEQVRDKRQEKEDAQ